MSESGLWAEGLIVRYGAREVLHGISLNLNEGEVLAVIGPNGCGKSTLLRALAGLLPLQSGEVRWCGRPLPGESRERARLVSLLPQHFSGTDELTVEEMALLGRTPYMGPYGVPGEVDRSAVGSALKLVANDLRSRKLSEISGGERQRALLARVYAAETPLVLLDEPVSALDIRQQYEILHMVRRQSRERGQAVVCVLHGINLAAAFADRMLLLDAGREVRSGLPETVMTVENLSRVYGMKVAVSPHPVSGRPQAQAMWDFEG